MAALGFTQHASLAIFVCDLEFWFWRVLLDNNYRFEDLLLIQPENEGLIDDEGPFFMATPRTPELFNLQRRRCD